MMTWSLMSANVGLIDYRQTAQVNMVKPWFVTSTETTRLIRDGEKGARGYGGGGREIIYLSLHCHQQNDSCIKMGHTCLAVTSHLRF